MECPTRYFVALLPPESLQAKINVIKQQFADCFHSSKALNSPPHITLQPPFDWPLRGWEAAPDGSPSFSEFTQQLAAFAAKQCPVSVTLQGFATFAPRVIYINVLPTLSLMALQRALSVWFETHWQVTDRRRQPLPFTPHVTVAFRDLTPQNFKAAWSEFSHQPFDYQFERSELTLLRHNGRRWECHSTFGLQS